MRALHFSAALLVSFASWASTPETAAIDSTTNTSDDHRAPVSLTLEHAIARTLRNNPKLYQFSFQQKRLAADRATSTLSPPMTLGLEIENFAGSDNFSELGSAETTLTLSSVIELGHKTRFRATVVDARIDRLKVERQAATLDVLGTLTTLYIDGVSTQESIKLAEDSVALSNTMLRTVERRAAKGAAPDVEVMRAKADVSRSLIRLEALKRKLERQKFAISSHWGARLPDFDTLGGSLFDFDTKADLNSLMQRAETSPAIAIFASEERLKEAELGLAKVQNRVDIGWQIGLRRFEGSDDTALTAGISIPLFNSRRNRGAVAAARIERDMVTHQKSSAQIELRNRLYAAFSMWEENTLTVARMDSSLIPALEETLALAKKAYESGRYRFQEWVIAQQELITAKQQQIEAATAAKQSQTLIEKLVAEPLSNPASAYELDPS